MIALILVLQIVFFQTVYGSVKWKLSTIPVVFGKTVKLVCGPCSYEDSKKWYGGADNRLLCSNGESYEEQKYYMTIHSSDLSFELNIRHFEISDIGIEYTCACQFQTYKQILLVPEYIYKPTKDMITFSHAEGENSVVQVNVTIEKTYPVPDCHSMSFRRTQPTGAMKPREYVLRGPGINPHHRTQPTGAMKPGDDVLQGPGINPHHRLHPFGDMVHDDYVLQDPGINPYLEMSTHHTSRKTYKYTKSNLTFYKTVFSNYTIPLEIGGCYRYLSITCSLGNEAFSVVDLYFIFCFNSRASSEKKLEQPKVNWYHLVCSISISVTCGLLVFIVYASCCKTYWQQLRWKRWCSNACNTLIQGLNVIICFCNVTRKREEISYERPVEEENPDTNELSESHETSDEDSF